MMKKHIVATLTASILLTGILGGCGAIGPGNSEEKATTTSAATTPTTAATTTTAKTEQSVTYTNSQLGYSVDYPAYFKNPIESDAGDGITLTAGTDKLLIWGSYNVNNDTGETLLNAVKNEIGDVTTENADETNYLVSYASDDAGTAMVTGQYGIIKNGVVVQIQYTFPDDENAAAKEDYLKSMMSSIVVSEQE
ncbi:MAG: hypothetical protein QM689_06565 [Oscillospiraceae bacterium]